MFLHFSVLQAVDLHVVLLEDLLVLLTRNSDGQRLSLRFHNTTFVAGKEDTKFTHCPLLKLSSLMAKNVATGMVLTLSQFYSHYFSFFFF